MAGVATGEGVEVRGPVDARCAGVLSADALAFVARLQREFGGRRGRAPAAPGGAPAGAGRRGAPGLPGRDARRAGGRLARGPGAGRPPGPAGGDHRAGRPQDDDQRLQLGGQGLHGRLRGLPLPHLGEPPGGAAQPDGGHRPHHLPGAGGRAGLPPPGAGGHPPRPPPGLAPAGEAPPGGRATRLGQPVRLRPARLPQRPAPPGAGQRALLLPAQAGEPPRGPAVERRLPPRRGVPGNPQGEHQGHGADRDDPRRVRDGGDPLRAAGALGRAQRRALGLHLQRHQEVPQRPRRSCSRTGPR